MIGQGIDPAETWEASEVAICSVESRAVLDGEGCNMDIRRHLSSRFRLGIEITEDRPMIRTRRQNSCIWSCQPGVHYGQSIRDRCGAA